MDSSLLLIAAVALLISPATSQPCKSRAFTKPDTTFANCTDLPTLKAQLHWTYDPLAKPGPTLSIAYVATPPKTDGWVAWALNPTGSGMVGAQALIAFRDEANGSIVVRTYGISEYGPIAESTISYEVLDKRAEYSGVEMRLFATLELPEGRTVVNQVWQVGASVRDGVPAKHDFLPENLGAKGILQLGNKAAEGPRGAAPEPARGNDTGGGSWRIQRCRGWCGTMIALGVVLGF